VAKKKAPIKKLSRSDLPAQLDQLLTRSEVAVALGLSVKAFQNRLNQPDHPFPPSELPGPSDPRWRTSTVQRWIDEECQRGQRV